MRLRSILSALLLLILFSAIDLVAAALPLYVHPDDPLNTYLDRMATRQILPRFLNDTRPLSRSDAAAALQIIWGRRDDLSNSEIELLKYYMADFHYDIKRLRHRKLGSSNGWWPARDRHGVRSAFSDVFSYRPYEHPPHFIIYNDGDNAVRFDLNEALRSENKGPDNRLIWKDNFRFSASIHDNFGIYFDATRFIQTYNEHYPEPSEAYRGGFLARLDEGLEYYSYDFSHAYITYQSAYGEFSYSNFPQIWGNSSHSLLLSGQNSAYPALQWSKKLGHSRFSFMHGFLLPYESERDSTFNNKVYVPKYIVGHRWEISPWPWMNAAFSEFIIYGDRDIEPTYMLPMIFLWSAQHNLNDRGNMLMALEAEIFPLKGLKLYGTFFLDELVFSQLFEQWWANKQGYQAGAHITPAKLLWSPEMRLEVSFVRPWTYTHKYDYNTFTHNGSGLGFPDGPNSFLVMAEARVHPSVRNKFILQHRRLLKGYSPENSAPVGEDPNQNYSERDPSFDNATEWIMGQRRIITRSTLTWDFMLSSVLRSKIILAQQTSDGKSDLYYHFQLSFNY